ncbi:mCG145983, partial [Mus musculus]
LFQFKKEVEAGRSELQSHLLIPTGYKTSLAYIKQEISFESNRYIRNKEGKEERKKGKEEREKGRKAGKNNDSVTEDTSSLLESIGETKLVLT